MLHRAALPLLLAVFAPACGGSAPAPAAKPVAPASPAPRADGGLPKAGPGDLYNACERIWCLAHEANFPLDHFTKGHDGWILHDDGYGDLFVPRGWSKGPGFPHARLAALRLCGAHLHPWLLGKGASGSAIKKTGYNVALGYSRGHFGAFGTRLNPCCLNGLGWAYLHSASPREFRLSDVELYREVTGSGWQAPFAARARS